MLNIKSKEVSIYTKALQKLTPKVLSQALGVDYYCCFVTIYQHRIRALFLLWRACLLELLS